MTDPVTNEGEGASDVTARIVERATAAAALLSESGRWGAAEERVLDLAFTEAAEAALSVPSIAERSIHLRRLARRVVPNAMRPALGRAARRFDSLIANARRRRRETANGSRP